MGTHRTKTWFTPAEVVHTIGEDTYRIKVDPGQFRKRHESQLRAREAHVRGKHVSVDYAAHEADSDDDYAEHDDYTVQKILAQRRNASDPGGVEFKLRWRGYGLSHDSMEPVSSFVPRINTPFMGYVRRQKTKLCVSDLEALTRAIEAMGARSPPGALSRMGRLSASLSGCQNVPCLLALSQLWCNVFLVEWLKCCASRAPP